MIGLVLLATSGVLTGSALASTSRPGASISQATDQSDSVGSTGVPGCSSTVLKTDRTWQLDTWRVGMSCWSNTSDKTLYVRGVLDVPGALDAHTPWVEIRPNTQMTVPAKQAMSQDVTSPWGEPTSRVDEYQCPPVSIGECSPNNNNNEVVMAFVSLLTNLF